MESTGDGVVVVWNGHCESRLAVQGLQRKDMRMTWEGFRTFMIDSCS
jgi:hypothetical protein